MDTLRFHALLIGMLCGYALGRRLHLGGPDAGPPVWEVLAATLGGGAPAHQVAEILVDDGDS
jgi:hypothetical protein